MKATACEHTVIQPYNYILFKVSRKSILKHVDVLFLFDLLVKLPKNHFQILLTQLLPGFTRNLHYSIYSLPRIIPLSNSLTILSVFIGDKVLLKIVYVLSTCKKELRVKYVVYLRTIILYKPVRTSSSMIYSHIYAVQLYIL